jgi:hypothetical protein
MAMARDDEMAPRYAMRRRYESGAASQNARYERMPTLRRPEAKKKKKKKKKPRRHAMPARRHFAFAFDGHQHGANHPAQRCRDTFRVRCEGMLTARRLFELRRMSAMQQACAKRERYATFSSPPVAPTH